MNRKNIWFVRGLLATQINHWAFFPILLFAFFGIAEIAGLDAPRPLLWLSSGAAPALLFVLRTKINKFWQLLLSHGAVAALWSVLSVGLFPVSGWVYAAAVCCYTVYSVISRLKSREEQEGAVNMPTALGISAVSLFILHSQSFREWDGLYPAALLIVAVLHFFAFYLERYLNFLKVSQSSAGHLPEREIFFSGIRMVVCYALVSAAAIFLVLASDLAWLQILLDWLRRAFICLLRLLFSGSESREPAYAPPENTPAPDGGFMEIADAGEPFFLWELLETAAKAAIIIGAVWLLARLLRRLPAFIRERMGRSRTMEVENAAAVWDVREKCGVKRQKNPADTGNPFAFMSAGERIRRLYKKRVLSAAKTRETGGEDEINPALFTAGEWGKRLHSEELAAPYEKARYSGEGCTTEDLRRMKLACRRSAGSGK